MPENNGWTVVRAPETDRIIEGAFTCEMRDLQGDFIPLEVFQRQMLEGDCIALNTPLIYKHAHDRSRGVVQLAPYMSAFRFDGKKGYARFAVTKGNRVVDDIWENEMKPMGARAGFSIGGKIPPAAKECRTERGKRICDVSDAIVCEISWTPEPANPEAKVNYVNQFAKEGETVEKADEKAIGAIIGAVGAAAGAIMGRPETEPTKGPSGKVEEEKCKPGCKCARCVQKEEEVRIKAFESELVARLEAIYKNVNTPVDAWKAVEGCGTCDDYVRLQVRMGKSVAQSVLKLQTVLSASQKDAIKPEGGTKLPEDDKDKKVPPEDGMKKELDGLKTAIVKELQEYVQKELAAMRKEFGQETRIGIGEGPLAGQPMFKPDDIDRNKMVNTKSIEEMIKALESAGYSIQKVKKTVPDIVPAGENAPSGLKPMQKADEKEPEVVVHFKKALDRM